MSLIRETQKTLALAFPLIAGQVSQMLLGLTDTLMIGRVGTEDLAAAAFANVLLYFPISLCIGLAVAVSIQVAHGHGRRSVTVSWESLRNGLLGSILLGLVLALLLAGCVPVLELFRQTPEVTRLAGPYLLWLAGSLVALAPSMVLKSFAEAQDHPWTVLWIQLGGVALNVVLNYLLIFGPWGLPALGLLGAGIATCAARFATLWWLWAYLQRSRKLAPGRPASWSLKPDRIECLQLVRIASPISGQLLLEIGAFSVGALLIGQFGEVALAAHQVAVTCAATTFMLPLGLSMAVTIRVGHTVAAGEPVRTRRIVLGAHAFSLGMMSVCAACYLLFGPAIAAAFSPDPAVVALAASIFVIVAVFQIFDGVQIVSMASLRGLKDVNIPTVYIFVCFWIIAIPLGSWLAFARDLGAIGMWVGLAFGLGAGSIGLTMRLIRRFRRHALDLPMGSEPA